MKKGFTIIEIIFLLVIIISFSIIIFEKETGIILVDKPSTTKEINTTKNP